jgi:ketosteroid isomerase-like protein
MLKRSAISMALVLMFAAMSFAQNAHTSTKTTVRPAAQTPEESGAQNSNTSTTTRTRRGRGNRGGANEASAKGVTAAFNALLDGIRRADVNAVTGIYWNSPQLILFNNNGTVTRGWEQMRENRASSYPDVKDVKLDVRDVRVQMLGRDGAVITCLWTQSQTFRGTPETATGRMTLVFRNIGGAWKAIHLHTSPDRPDPSRLLPSEQTETPTPTPTPKPKTKP